MKYKTQKRILKKYNYLKHFVSKHVFDDYGYRGIEETVARIEKYRGEIRKLLHIISTIRLLDPRYSEYRYNDSVDDRAGWETYGYKSIENIDGNLMYISDRFLAEFRLIWMLGIPVEYHRLKKSLGNP